jgi:sodium/bile acid cotransporter 7
VAVLPSTVQSSIAFTSIAGGNIPAAVCAASISSLLGIFLTPVMASGLMSLNGGGVSLDEIWRVVLQLFVPFAAGHLLRPWIGKWVDRHRQILSTTDRGSILLAVYTAFSAAVVEGIWHKLAVPQMLMIVVVAITLLALVMVIVYLFCGSKKSLAAGIPMAKVLFAAPLVGVMVLPLMIFHQVQLMVCAFLARRFAAGIPAERSLGAAASSSQGAVGA